MEFSQVWNNLSEILVFLSIGISAYALSVVKEWYKKRRTAVCLNSINQSVRIREILSEVMTYFEADRAKFFQFHNGEYFVSGESIMKLSMTHVTMKAGVGYPTGMQTEYQGILTGYLANTLQKVIDHPCLFKTNDTSGDSYLKHLFIINGVKQIYMVPVKNLKGNWLGIIVLTWLNDDFEVNLDHDKFMEYAAILGGCASPK